MDRQSRKAALLQEFEREIAPARMRLAAQLPGLWQQTYGYAAQSQAAAIAATGIAKAGSKRVSGAGGAGAEFKRPRTEEMERRMEPLFKECQKIIKKLHNIQSSSWFRRPVDPQKDGIPNYFHYIKQPMDLGTIRTRLQTKHYRTPLEFKDDVDLVWANCAAYNQEGSDARIAGDKCKDVFERAWRDAGIEAQLQAMQDEPDTNAPTQGAASVHERLHALSSQLARTVEQLPAFKQEGGARGDMSFAEKRRLSTRLCAWMPPEQYQAVLDIVSQDPRAAMAAEGEVEVELDDLRADTLWRLQDLLDPQAPRPVAQQRAVAARPLAVEGGAGNTADKRLPARQQNGAASMQSSGASGSESDSGEHSPNEVKGSTMDDPRQGPTNFVRDARHGVDESATNPKEQSQFVKDRAAARKADVNINAANWDSLPSMPSADAGAADVPQEGDDMWKSFQSIAEQKQQREEQQRMEAEAAERQKREERERQKREEEERQRRLKEEEERQQAEMQRQREAQLQKELEEIKAQAGTANLTPHNDIALLANMTTHSADSGGLAAVGLELADDNDMMFEDI